MLPRLSADEVRVRRAQLALEDLAAGVLGQPVGDGHVPGRLVAGESLAAERHELVGVDRLPVPGDDDRGDRKSTRLNSSHANISYAVFCLKKKKTHTHDYTLS